MKLSIHYQGLQPPLMSTCNDSPIIQETCTKSLIDIFEIIFVSQILVVHFAALEITRFICQAQKAFEPLRPFE